MISLMESVVKRISMDINELLDNAFMEICCKHGIININDIYVVKEGHTTKIHRKSDGKKLGVISQKHSYKMEAPYTATMNIKYKVCGIEDE